MSGWRQAHGDEFEVPAQIEKAFVDASWHNGVCPHFVTPLETHSLWVDHPDPGQRELGPGTPRYCITDDRGGYGGVEVFRTDDVHRAVARFRRIILQEVPHEPTQDS